MSGFSRVKTSIQEFGADLRTSLARRLGGLGGLSLETDTSELDSSSLEKTVSSGGSLWRSHLHIGHVCAEIRQVDFYVEQVSPAEVDTAAAEELGRGAGGIVMRAMIVPNAVCARLAGKPVAVKVVNVGDKAKREQLVTEVNILLRLTQESQTLINCYGAFVQGDCVRVVLEYMDWSLSQVRRHAGKVPATVLPLFLMQILNGICALHEQKVLHRDVKCGNILVNKSGEVKVTDFGISKMTSSLDDLSVVCTSFVGTLSHMSPERLMGEDYSYASDIWSVGVITYELASGTYPYGDIGSFIQLSNKVCNEPAPDLPEAVATPQLQSFLADCMQKDHSLRKCAKDLLLDELFVSHPDVVSHERCCMVLVPWLDQVMAIEAPGSPVSVETAEILGIKVIS